MQGEWNTVLKGKKGSDPGISHALYFPLRTKAYCVALFGLDETNLSACMGTFLLFTVNSETRDFHLSFIFTTFSRKIAALP